MKFPGTLALLLLSSLLLSGCGSSGENKPPESYCLGDNQVPSISSLVQLGDDVQFQQTQNEDTGVVTYAYSQLSSGAQAAQSYTQLLEQDYGCRILEDGATGQLPDFSSPTGEVLTATNPSDTEEVLLLTIQWEESSCTVTPTQTTKSQLPQSPSGTITLSEAEDYLRSLSPSYLGLSGQSMDQYLALPQKGTVLLDGRPCLCINLYLIETHQLEQSYLLSVPELQVYRLDRETGQAILLE